MAPKPNQSSSQYNNAAHHHTDYAKGMVDLLRCVFYCKLPSTSEEQALMSAYDVNKTPYQTVNNEGSPNNAVTQKVTNHQPFNICVVLPRVFLQKGLKVFFLLYPTRLGLYGIELLKNENESGFFNDHALPWISVTAMGGFLGFVMMPLYNHISSEFFPMDQQAGSESEKALSPSLVEGGSITSAFCVFSFTTQVIAFSIDKLGAQPGMSNEILCEIIAAIFASMALVSSANLLTAKKPILSLKELLPPVATFCCFVTLNNLLGCSDWSSCLIEGFIPALACVAVSTIAESCVENNKNKLGDEYSLVANG
jgi:hypothetical protein